MTQPDNPNVDYLGTPKRSVAVRIVLLLIAVTCIGAAVTLAFMRGRGTAVGGSADSGATPNAHTDGPSLLGS